MIYCTQAITLRWNFFISNSSTDLTVLLKIATQWSFFFFFLHCSWLMPSCIHRDRELHRDQNHNINYRKTCITTQILATFLLGKLNLNYKMNIVKQDSKFAKKKTLIQVLPAGKCSKLVAVRCHTTQFRQQ